MKSENQRVAFCVGVSSERPQVQPNQPLYACRMDAQPIRGKLALWVVELADGCVINPVCDGSDFRTEIRDWPPQPTQLAEKFVEIVVASCGENQHSSHMQGRGAFASVQSVCLEITARMLAATTNIHC